MGKKLKSLFYNKTFIWLLLIILIGTILRFIGLNKDSGMWYDELTTYNTAKQSFPFGILSHLYYDVHPPLYYFFLHFWIKLFGETDYMLRLLSVIFGVLTMPVMYLTGKELDSKKTGLIATLLISINSLMIYFSQEIRSYSLITFLCMLSFYFLLKIKNNPGKWSYAGFALTNTAILYTYIMGSLFIFIEVSIMLIYLTYKDRKSLKPFIITQISTLLLFSPYISFFIQQCDYANKFLWIYSPFSFWKLLFVIHDWFSPIMVNLNFARDDFYIKLFSSRPTEFENLRIYLNSAPYFVVFAILPVIIYFFGIIKSLTSSKKMLLIFSSGLLILLFELFSALNNKAVFETRYTLFFLPLFILVAGYGFSELKNKGLKVFLIVSLVFLNLFYIFSNPVSAPKAQRPFGCKSILNITNKYHFDKNSVVVADFVYKDALNKYYLENNNHQMPKIVSFDYNPLIRTIIDPQNKYKNADILHDHKFLKNYLLSDQIPETLKNYFSNNVQIKKGSYLAINYLGPPLKTDQEVKDIVRSDKLYNITNPFDLFPSRLINSLNQLAAQKLELVYADEYNNWNIYIYKKIK